MTKLSQTYQILEDLEQAHERIDNAVKIILETELFDEKPAIADELIYTLTGMGYYDYLKYKKDILNDDNV